MIKWLREMLLLNVVLLPPMLLFPAICLTLAAHPDPLAAQLCFWFGPLSAGFYVLVYSQWSSAHAWNKMGRLKQWREDHGGFLCTIPRACGWLLFGIIGSFLSEVAFMLAFKHVPFEAFDGTARLRLWLCLFPLACYFPLLPAWVWRRRHV
jgi:hypothetical protein